jgi:hypothetical protein
MVGIKAFCPPATNVQKDIISLPPNSLVDLLTFEMIFQELQNRGKTMQVVIL